jgi:hypothetical protein
MSKLIDARTGYLWWLQRSSDTSQITFVAPTGVSYAHRHGWNCMRPSHGLCATMWASA